MEVTSSHITYKILIHLDVILYDEFISHSANGMLINITLFLIAFMSCHVMLCYVSCRYIMSCDVICCSSSSALEQFSPSSPSIPTLTSNLSHYLSTIHTYHDHHSILTSHLNIIQHGGWEPQEWEQLLQEEREKREAEGKQGREQEISKKTKELEKKIWVCAMKLTSIIIKCQVRHTTPRHVRLCRIVSC